MVSPAQLLIVSPDAAVRRALEDCAASLGHAACVAVGVAEARRVLSRLRVDLICLDSVLPAPEVDDFYRRLCAVGARPGVLFFAPRSAKLVPASLPAAFSASRDAIVTKPIALRDVECEVARLLAARNRGDDDHILRAGSLVLDARSHELFAVEGGPVSLTPTEYRMVRYLMERPGDLIAPDELLEEAWGYPKGTGGAEVVRAHVSNVRRKLRAAGVDPRLLRGVPYRGYGFAVEEEAGARTPRTAGHSR